MRIPTLELRNGILLDPDGIDPQADITVSMNRATFNQLASTPDGLDKALDSGQAKLPKGQAPIYREFWGYFDNPVFSRSGKLPLLFSIAITDFLPILSGGRRSQHGSPKSTLFF